MEDDLRVQVARLEERMNTMQAEYLAALDRTSKDTLKTVVAVVAAGVAILGVALGAMITLN